MYMEPRKIILMKLFAWQQWRYRHREQAYGHGEAGGRSLGYMERVTWKLPLPHAKYSFGGKTTKLGRTPVTGFFWSF